MMDDMTKMRGFDIEVIKGTVDQVIRDRLDSMSKLFGGKPNE